MASGRADCRGDGGQARRETAWPSAGGENGHGGAGPRHHRAQSLQPEKEQETLKTNRHGNKHLLTGASADGGLQLKPHHPQPAPWPWWRAGPQGTQGTSSLWLSAPGPLAPGGPWLIDTSDTRPVSALARPGTLRVCRTGRAAVVVSDGGKAHRTSRCFNTE